MQLQLHINTYHTFAFHRHIKLQLHTDTSTHAATATHKATATQQLQQYTGPHAITATHTAAATHTATAALSVRMASTCSESLWIFGLSRKRSALTTTNSLFTIYHNRLHNPPVDNVS